MITNVIRGGAGSMSRTSWVAIGTGLALAALGGAADASTSGSTGAGRFHYEPAGRVAARLRLPEATRPAGPGGLEIDAMNAGGSGSDQIWAMHSDGSGQTDL